MNFGDALLALKTGNGVLREGWSDRGVWISIKHSYAESLMSQSYIYMKTANDDLVPWVASQADLLANDWVVVK